MNRHENELLIALIALCSLLFLSGCAAKTELSNFSFVPAPVLVTTEYCPAPVKLTLPNLDRNFGLDSTHNLKILLERDDLIRAYNSAQSSTIKCYEAQVKK